jgi:hypothetical protein
MCMYICMYTYICIHTYVYIRVYINAVAVYVMLYLQNDFYSIIFKNQT